MRRRVAAQKGEMLPQQGEGGGARGAYHIGVMQAYLENGYAFDGFVGTSIGAVNAAILAQGDFDKALELWKNISMDQLFDVDEQHFLRFINHGELHFDRELPSHLRKALWKIIKSSGIDTVKMKEFLEVYIDEEKIRTAGKDFGLVTVSINERKPYELMLEEIPRGALVDFVMASSSFPGFQPETIEENKFLDGALYNNCPVNLLVKKGYTEIIAVRTNAPGVLRKIDSATKVTVITPNENLGSIMLFTPQNSEANIKLGYYDGLRSIKKLRGQKYYVSPANAAGVLSQLAAVADYTILEIGKILNIPAMPAKRMMFEKIIPQLGSHLKLNKDFGYVDFAVAVVEQLAVKRGVERYRVYEYGEFLEIVKKAALPEKRIKIMDKVSDSGFLNRKKAAVKLLAENILGTKHIIEKGL